MIFFVDFRGRDVGGPVLPGKVVFPALADPSATEDALRLAERVIVLVHGFNVDRPSGQAKLHAFAGKLPGATDAAIVAVTWPGDSWAGAASYPFEGNDADDTAIELARFLDRVIIEGTPLSFASHSLGARVVFGAIERLEAGRYPIGQLCVMAAAVDDFSVSAPADYRPPVEAAERVAVLASQSDSVLKWAYPLGDLLQSFLFFWKDHVGLALGYHGPRPYQRLGVPTDVLHEQIATSLEVSHGDYLFDGEPSAKQARAAAFANAVLAGEAAPRY